MKTANPINTTNAMGKKRKRPKNAHKGKKDEENILSKDVDDENIRYMMDTKKNMKPREDLKSSFTLKNLRFKPQKYKGSFLPYHLRWIFNNNVKSNEIVLFHEIEGLENEINRLKCLKIINRECRKIAGLPFGIATNFCQCCHLFEKKKHDCSHKYCNDNCPKKKAEELMQNLLKNNKLNAFKNNNNQNSNINNNNSNINNENNKNNLNINNDNNNQSNAKISLNPNNNNVNNENQTQEPPKTYIINLSKSQSQPNKNNNNNETKNNTNNNKHLTTMDIYKSNNNSNNTKDIIEISPVKAKRRPIFGIVERPAKEKRSIFLIHSDNNMGSSNTVYNYDNDSDSSNSDIKQINLKSDSDNKKKDYEIDNYTVSIESDEIEENEEVIDINNDNENEVNEINEKDSKNNNEKDEIRIEEKNENENKDKDDEDDVIIINQTSPHNSDNEN